MLSMLDSRNQGLYNDIRSRFEVDLIPSSDHQWGVEINENGRVVVEHAPTAYAHSAFTHELLHIDTQIKGYNRIKYALGIDPRLHGVIPGLVQCLDNEFQHHKMFPLFSGLGFPAQEFYHDGDSAVMLPYITNSLEVPGQSFASISIDYMSLIAPGGSISTDQRTEMKDRFLAYGGGQYRDKFGVLDGIINEWASTASYDATPFLIRFFENLDMGSFWISAFVPTIFPHQDFPTAGYFTGSPFSLSDLRSVYRF